MLKIMARANNAAPAGTEAALKGSSGGWLFRDTAAPLAGVLQGLDLLPAVGPQDADEPAHKCASASSLRL
jgi:hypothetical protein